MDIRTAPLLLALLALPLPAVAERNGAVDLPARFVSTWQDEGLQGRPRRVLMQEISQRRFPPQRLTEDRYNEAGLHISHMTSSREGDYASPESYRLHFDKGRLHQVMYAPAHFGNGFMAGSATPRQFDDEGRVIVMVGHPPLAPRPLPATGEPAADSKEIVTFIRYEAERQTQDVFVGTAFSHRLVFEFAAGRRWRSSCVDGHCASAVLEEYADDGLLRRVSGSIETQWHYENGVPVAMVTRNIGSGTLIERVHFEAYRFDSCGNWIYREHYDAAPFSPGRQRTGSTMRKLEYFEPCAPRTAAAP